jgi:hypothetical protein
MGAFILFSNVRRDDAATRATAVETCDRRGLESARLVEVVPPLTGVSLACEEAF